MMQTVIQSESLLQRITRIVQLLIDGNNIYQERLTSQEMINLIYQIFCRSSHIDLSMISDDELIARIDSVLMVHAVAGTLNDLTADELKTFNEIVGD